MVGQLTFNWHPSHWYHPCKWPDAREPGGRGECRRACGGGYLPVMQPAMPLARQVLRQRCWTSSSQECRCLESPQHVWPGRVCVLTRCAVAGMYRSGISRVFLKTLGPDDDCSPPSRSRNGHVSASQTHRHCPEERVNWRALALALSQEDNLSATTSAAAKAGKSVKLHPATSSSLLTLQPDVQKRNCTPSYLFVCGPADQIPNKVNVIA